MRPDGTTVGYWALRIKGDTQLAKYKSALALIDGVLHELPTGDRLHFVEDRLGNYSQGKTMRQTLMVLAGMNAVVSHHLNCDAPVTHILPVSAKRIVGLKVPKGGDKKAEAIKLVRALDGDRFPFRLTREGNPAPG